MKRNYVIDILWQS